MIFNWFKNRRRRKLIAKPFPERWEAYLFQNVHFYQHLSLQERHQMQDDLRILMAEKYWEGCGGLTVTDEIQVTIAAQAALLTIGLKDQYFENVETILVYPSSYIATEKKVTAAGVVIENQSAREGEAWQAGPVILSWDNVLQGGRNNGDGRNLVLHEFAHKLDMQNGGMVDGTPWMETKAHYDRWQQILHHEYQELLLNCQQGHHTLLSCYATTNMAEFFAVATECFFEQPHQMQYQHSDLYHIFSNYYQQNPVTRGGF